MLAGRMDEGQAEFDRLKAIGTTPTVTVANVAGTIPAGGTGAAAGAWDTSGNRDTAITTLGEIRTQLNALLTTLRNKGLIT